MSIYERVKQIAEERGFALTEVAQRAGIGEKSIYAWKPSKQYPDGVTPKRATLEKVAAVLGVTADDLLGLPDSANSTKQPQAVKTNDLDQLLSDEGVAMFNGQPLSDDYKHALLAMLNTLNESEH
ncbi:transcriptional regulator with XRE-family HTH domain [Weissella uvarum]|uniref:helix-turn-helix domain-containing protein n=1 Tax=Weissella uvarum TaxID=1479233 RepID=UPI001960E2E4|nr:helix-turn-helix transcriptional regulator [Weissella uvarum]MBM7617315.1 transcriptional regulator with XRE-family HTH domain [Weissella uvarum]MCM0595182.1 helix-turn-helix transcriptional regulator [Weissella uvarum]